MLETRALTKFCEDKWSEHGAQVEQKGC